MTLLLCISHLTAFLLGGVTWAAITEREGGRLMGKGETVDDSNKGHRWNIEVPEVPGWLVVLLVAGAVVIGLGIQQWFYQRDADEQAAAGARRDACYQKWGRDVTSTLRVRVKVNTRLEHAQAERADATAQVIRTVIGLRTVPPLATDRDLDRALHRADRADTRVDTLTRTAHTTRAKNPYPVLDCR